MVRTIVERQLERAIFARRCRQVELGLPGPVGRDDNNLFSLHEVSGIDGIDAVSFDFFDTLFFRDHLCLSEVFEKTAQLGADLIPGERARAAWRLFAARGYPSFQAKRIMQARGRGDEPRLASVFARVLEPMVPDAEARAALAERLAAIEARVELNNLVPNAEAAALFRNLRLLGRKIIIASDMYLPASALEAVLARHGLLPSVDHLLVSSEYGVTKQTGGLFDVVIEKAGVAPGRILHVGDNWNNDVQQARARGLKALHYYNHEREAGVKRRERLHALPEPGSVRAERVRRSFSLAAPEPLAGLDRILSEVIGPAAALFVHDVLTRAAREGTSHIYFLTRDGTIFKDIADAMVRAVPQLYDHGAERRILATSRASGSLMGFERSDGDYLYITTEYLTEDRFTLARFLEVWGIAPRALDSLTPGTRAILSEVGEAPDLGGFRRLYGCHDFNRLVWQSVQAARATLTGYLEQEGLFTATRPLLVDIGYSGTWGKQLSRLLEDRETAGQPVPDIAYEFFATNRFYPDNVRQFHPSLTMGPGRILDHRRIDCAVASLNYAWLEPFFLDPALGKLEGFRAGRVIEPVFAPARFDAGGRARIEGMRHALIGRCVQFAEDLLRHEGEVEELRRLVRDRLVRLVTRPRRAEVAAINALVHERGMNALKGQEIALKFYPNNFRAKIDYLMMNDHWVQGSLARSRMGVLNPLLSWYVARTRPALSDWKP